MRKTQTQCPPKRKAEASTETKESTTPSEVQWTKSTLNTLTTDWATATQAVQEEVLLLAGADDHKGFIIIHHKFTRLVPN